jgi:L-lactate permease
MMQKIGSWAFIVGVVVALVAPIFAGLSTWLITLLIILGLVIGFLNITVADTQTFLLAALALVIVSGFSSTSGVITQVTGIGPALGRIFGGLLLLVVPATIIVALRSIYTVSRRP